MTSETWQQREMTIAEAIALGIQAHRNGQINEAEEIYRRVLEAWPQCPDALHFSGLIAFAKGDIAKATALIEDSLEAAPAHADFWNNFGNILKAQGRQGEALIAYRRAIELRPESADAHNNIGVMASIREDYQAAADAYRAAIQFDSKHAGAYLNLGNALAKLEMLPESIEAYRVASDLKPGDPEAYGRMGQIFWQQGRMKEATEAISRNIEIAPGDSKAFVVLAGIFYTQGLLDESFSAYRKSLEINPTDGYANCLFGQTLVFHGRVDEAKEVWRKWLAADPENPVPRHLLAAGSDDEVPARTGDDFVVRIFDNFAESFDKKLKHLEYRAPELVTEALRGLITPSATLDVLDAGCGTGLCGPLLRPFARRLEGVDLSPKMLDKARERKDYDELVAAELTQFIADKNAAYDLIASADTLCYFGKLEGVFAAALTALRSGGYFIFTVEKTPESKGASRVTLEQSGRYTHKESYVRSAIERSGFDLTELTFHTLRLEFFKPVEGMVVVARKPLA